MVLVSVLALVFVSICISLSISSPAKNYSWGRNGAESALTGSGNVINNLESAQMPGIIMQAHANEAKVVPVQSAGLCDSGAAVKGFFAGICLILASFGNNHRGG